MHHTPYKLVLCVLKAVVVAVVVVCILSIIIIIGVAPDRQKVMIGGVTLADDSWGKAEAKIKDVCHVYIVLWFIAIGTFKLRY